MIAIGLELEAHFYKDLLPAPGQPKEPPKGPESLNGTPRASEWIPNNRSGMGPKGHQIYPTGDQMDPKTPKWSPKSH